MLEVGTGAGRGGLSDGCPTVGNYCGGFKLAIDQHQRKVRRQTGLSVFLGFGSVIYRSLLKPRGVPQAAQGSGEVGLDATVVELTRRGGLFGVHTLEPRFRYLSQINHPPSAWVGPSKDNWSVYETFIN